MWVSEDELSPAWLKANCGIVCERCTITDLSGATAPRSCFRLSFHPPRETLVLKQNSVNVDGSVLPRHDLSLGTAREGLFYKHLASEQGPLVPVVMYAEGNMTTGAKCIIMEDLGQWIDSGRLLGPTNPHNWGRDLAADVKEAGGPSERQVALATFLACAKLHARYWRDEKLLSVPWLAHAEWVRGENRAAWEASLEFTRAQWSKGKGSVVGWFDATVFDAVEKAVECTSWESQRTRLNEKTHWTLVHGDCWAGNVMWHKNGRVKLVDWEMAGVGSGPQDIGQYVISGVHPDVRRLHEHGLVHDYYDELIRCGLTGFTFEECWREYTLGGVEKWLFFLCYLAGEDLPDWTRAFHDQVLCFMKDHGITAADIRQFRP